MASKKSSGHREPPKQINIEKLIHFFTQEFGESASASEKTQLDSSDPSPGKTSDWFKRNVDVAKIIPSVNQASTSGAGKRVCSVGIEQLHDSEFKKPKGESMNDPELKYRCSFCSQRFPSLTNVRDHTRACHREENERRKEERLNTSSAKATTVHKNAEPELRPNLTQNPESIHTHLFRCITCKFASVSYDHMIEHCQNHIIKFENPYANIQCDITKKYVICGEKFDIDFDTYNKCVDGLNHSYAFINCDYNLLKHDKWPGIFTSLPKSEIDKINCTSIYYFTRIIRLTSRKKPASAPFMVYQCKKCMKYIDPHSILAHVQENSCNEHNADFPCYICKKPFLNENTMYLHYKMHKAADNSNVKFRKILFNDYDDDLFNAVLLKVAGYTMNIVPRKATVKRPSNLAKAQTEVKNNQTNEKEQINIQSAPSGSNTVLGYDDTNTKMQFKYDARSMIIQGSKTGSGGGVGGNGGGIGGGVRVGCNQNTSISEITSTVTKEVDKIDTVYKCKCDLCFHGVEFLLKHLEICRSDSKSTIICYLCRLVFNEEQYQIHNGIHSQGFTKLNVKKITMYDEKIVTLNNKCNSHVENEIKQMEYNELCRKAISKLVYTIQNVALAHFKGYKKEDITAQKIIAAAAKRSLGSATDNLIKTVLKTQGTMTVTRISINEVNKDIGNKNQASNTKSVGSGTDDLNTTVMKSQETMTNPVTQTVCKVNKGVDNIKQINQTKSVGLGTDDLNISVMKSQGTMTTPEIPTVYKVNKGVDNIKQVSQTKSVGLGTDDLNISVMKSQGTMTTPETQTVYKVSKGVDNIKQVSQTKSVGLGTDDLKISGMKSQGTMIHPETQTVHEVNKDCNTKEEGKTFSSLSRTNDLIFKVQKANEAKTEATNKLQSSVEKLLKFTRIVNDINVKYQELNKNFSCRSDNMEENQSMVESTLEAEMNEITVTEKNKRNCDTESTGSKKESGDISMTRHEDCNKTIIKECDKTEKVHTNKNDGVNAFEPLAENNNTLEEIMETSDSEKDKEVKTAQDNAESKIYTEDELLNGPEMPVYFDAEESILTDDDDPILLYEDDDVD